MIDLIFVKFEKPPCLHQERLYFKQSKTKFMSTELEEICAQINKYAQEVTDFKAADYNRSELKSIIEKIHHFISDASINVTPKLSILDTLKSSLIQLKGDNGFNLSVLTMELTGKLHAFVRQINTASELHEVIKKEQ